MPVLTARSRWAAAVLRDLAAKAGFAQVRHVEMDNPFNSLYELTR